MSKDDEKRILELALKRIEELEIRLAQYEQAISDLECSLIIMQDDRR